MAQTPYNIDSLLSKLSGKSAVVSLDSSAQRILINGDKSLPILATKFTDSTISNVYSDCIGRKLKRGELAIILADHIESMPYFQLTGMQNCMMQSCPDNSNFVEYYLEFVRFRNLYLIFQQRYNEWLVSAERRKYQKAVSKE